MALQWYGEQRKREIEAEMTRRIRSATRLVHARARKLLSVAGTRKAKRSYSYMGWTIGEDGKRVRIKRKVRKGATLYNEITSTAGEPPRKQTGQLRRSVATEVTGTVGRVGTNVPYGKWLELGTRKMAARPWLRRALAESADAIRGILGRPIR